MSNSVFRSAQNYTELKLNENLFLTTSNLESKRMWIAQTTCCTEEGLGPGRRECRGINGD